MKQLLVLLSVALMSASGQVVGVAVTYDVNDQPYEGYYISPKENAPLVLLIHDWDGLTEYEILRARMLADLGYAVFAADLYGAGVRPTSIEDKRQQSGDLYKDRAKMRLLMYGALDAAKKQGANVSQAVAIGYCFGGTSILELARSGANLKGFVSFHGGLKTPENQDYANTKAPILVLHGTADSSVSMQDFAALAVELETTGISHEMTTYSGAPHAFTVIGSNRYHEEADKKSWARFVGFLSETLK